MPRRYSDYADTFLFWNVVSSFGSLISLLGAFYLLAIIWYCLSTFPVSASSLALSLDATDRVGVSWHTFGELVRYY